MAISQIGMIIRKRRTELKLSQEDLCDGICAVPTLSRIENGERMPTQNHLELLLQRIGYSDMMLHSYVDENDFVAHELKFKIRQANIEKDADSARKYLDEFEKMVGTPSPIDEQFIILQKILLFPERYSDKERLEGLQRAILLTQPKYGAGHFPYLLSYEEIVILNNIAAVLAKCGRRAESIDILYGIVKYYDTHIVNEEEALRTKPMVLYNLSKILGMESRLDECIDICEQGIQLAQRTGKSQCFGPTLYNKAWALVKRKRPEDLPEARDLAQRAMCAGVAFQDPQLAERARQLIQVYELMDY